MVLFISLWRVPVAPEVPTFLAYLSNFRALRLYSSFVTSPFLGGGLLRPCGLGESLGSCAGGWSSLTGPTVLRGCWACVVLPARGKGLRCPLSGVSPLRSSRSRRAVYGAYAPLFTGSRAACPATSARSSLVRHVPKGCPQSKHNKSNMSSLRLPTKDGWKLWVWVKIEPSGDRRF